MSAMSCIPGQITHEQGSRRLSRPQRSSRGIWGAVSRSGPRNVGRKWASERGPASGAASLTFVSECLESEASVEPGAGRAPGVGGLEPLRAQVRAWKARRVWFAHATEGPTGPRNAGPQARWLAWTFQSTSWETCWPGGQSRWPRALRALSLVGWRRRPSASGLDTQLCACGGEGGLEAPAQGCAVQRERAAKSFPRRWRFSRAWSGVSPAEMDGIQSAWILRAKARRPETSRYFFLIFNAGRFLPLSSEPCVPVREWWGLVRGVSSPSSPHPTGKLPSGPGGEGRGVHSELSVQRPWPREGGEGPNQVLSPQRAGLPRPVQPQKGPRFGFSPRRLSSQSLLLRKQVVCRP